MGVLDLIRPRQTYVRTVYVGGESVLGMSASRLYQTQPALRSVISFLADNVAGLPLKCYIRKPDGSRERDRDSALAKVLSNPNGWTTGHELIRATVSDYLLYDSALWLTIPAQTDSGWMVANIPHDWVKYVTANGMEAIVAKVSSQYMDGRTISITSDDFIRFAGWSPNGAVDTSPRIDALKEILAEQISAWNFRNGVWKNGGRVTQWISRPAGVEWGEGARDRFAKSWKEKFSGENGTDTGGTPLLEDGMRLETTAFNAREAQWAEATRLSREDVCAVYHVNPGLIYHTDATTYASAKDNARALYSETLAPLMDYLEERINAFLVPRLGLDSSHYCEFDLAAKLQGSFEEQAAVISSAVGAPWMTRNEARVMRNLPRIDGGDELIVPLNVLEGGQASPRDSVADAYQLSAPAPMAKSEPKRLKSEPMDADAAEIADMLRKFFKRQGRAVTARLAKDEEWWDGERWDRELSDDLYPILQRQANKTGRETSREAFDGMYDVDRTVAYITTIAKNKAQAINNVTRDEIEKALDGEIGEDAEGATVEGVFEKAEEVRAETSGRSFATAIAGFAILEACNQRSAGRKVTKTWIVTSGNPRPEHAAMDGETVPYDADFSNGARFPGDHVLLPEESCNCLCQVEITVS